MRVCDYCQNELNNDNWTIEIDDFEDVCDSCWKEQNPKVCCFCYSNVEEDEDHHLCTICGNEYGCPSDKLMNADICQYCQEKVMPRSCERCGELNYYKYLMCLHCQEFVFDNDIEVIIQSQPKEREQL